ncbi:MAG: ferredoxin reductase family protein [Solirubrobacteraceae bacterium]|nr:ferredoxin reductase family protein [Solirubrobacteraceae bacterium]
MTNPSLWIDRPADEGPRVATPELRPRVAPRARRRPLRPARRRPWVVDTLAAVAGLGLGATLALGIAAESAGSLSAAGGLATAAGRLTGLVAAYAMVVVVVLVARFPPLERAIGQDRLVRWHRKLGPYPLFLLAAHGILITVGYAQAAGDGVLHQFGQLLWTYPGVLAATVGGAFLILAGVTSYKRARRRMAYETWWTVHLYTYLALFLSFSHQVDTGASFVGHPANTFWWTALWIGTLALVVICRVGLPVWRSLRHQVRVVAVEPAGPGAVSVILGGRRLDRLPVAGGQFLQWRFLRRGMWWQAHPYSLSETPDAGRLRITVKDLGDHSRAVSRLRPGTRVAIEGPYGAFTADARERDRVLLVAAGVGSAPILSVLGDLPEHVDVTVVLRGHSPQDLLLRDEIVAEVRRRGGHTHEVVGPRERVRLTAESFRRAVPDIAERDVYLCGPEGFMDGVRAAVLNAGVAPARIHFESFAT